MRRAPRVLPDCTYAPRPDGQSIRVYHTIDTRLILEDFYAKLKIHYGD